MGDDELRHAQVQRGAAREKLLASATRQKTVRRSVSSGCAGIAVPGEMAVFSGLASVFRSRRGPTPVRRPSVQGS